MRVLRFQIRLPTGQVDQLNIESERVLIGSGAHCEIRLPLDQAKIEHVLIELGPAGVFARAMNFEPAPTINNIPFTQAPLPPESVLGVNQTQIFVMASDSAGAGPTSGVQGQKKKTSPITLIAVLLMLPAGLYLVLGDDGATQGPKMPKEPPELWGPPIVSCPQSGPAAMALGRERLAVADGKRERRPFHVQDGVQAVPLYETAGACFRAAGEQPYAAYCEETARALRVEITNDYRTQRVRLEHALNVEDWQGALKGTHTLLQYVEGRQGEYVAWLTQLERRMRVKVSEKPKT